MSAAEVIETNTFQTFQLGEFSFRRDQYFAHVSWPQGEHILSIDHFLRALMRDVAWNFFYGTVNFDEVIGTINHYGEVELFAGHFNENYRAAGMNHIETFKTPEIAALFKAMLNDWCAPDFDPFAAPRETGSSNGEKKSGLNPFIDRKRETAKRMVSLPGDAPLRTDDNGYPVNSHFADIDQSQPVIEPEDGFAGQLQAFNLFGYLSRSDVTWNPSISSVLEDSLFCPTTEEFILPIKHGNDRVEWFIQLTDEITWEVEDKATGKPRAVITMKAGDVAAMPADIRHQGYSPKRSMLLVWENASKEIPSLIEKGLAPTIPVEFG